MSWLVTSGAKETLDLPTKGLQMEGKREGMTPDGRRGAHHLASRRAFELWDGGGVLWFGDERRTHVRRKGQEAGIRLSVEDGGPCALERQLLWDFWAGPERQFLQDGGSSYVD